MAGAPPPFSIEYEPRLCEEAVLAALRGHPAEAAFRASRDALYATDEPEEREERFRALHAAWFERLRLDRPLVEAIDELPCLATSGCRLLVTMATSGADEGAELFVTAGPVAPRGTVVLRLRPGIFAQAERLRALCRHELLHVADLLTPDFAFTPAALRAVAGPLPEALLRERYRVLWNASVDGRLHRLGWASPGARETRLREFGAAFPMLGARLEEAFERFFSGPRATHPALIAFATAPERARGGTRPGPHPGARCPLCACPTHVFVLDPEALAAETREAIRRSAPGWEPGAGLCRQCADVYEVIASRG